MKNIREYIISKGGQVLFNEQVTDFEIEEGIVLVDYKTDKALREAFENFKKSGKFKKHT